MRFATTLTLFLAACQPALEIPPPPPPARAVLTLYMHPDGKTNCVEAEGGEWQANPACCPKGFSPAGFSAPSATLYLDESNSPNRRIFRHLVCLEDRG
ncbi:MAG: hypothetical protein EP330_29765 [Deltaproteobacteria bacterium]|nr:MAG: hypothetical protein EP330_29765 [Deltaproteobacteria bacterium]